MKKIIGILLAGALVTSAFAADVSAKVKVDGSLLNFDGKNFSALKVQHNSEGWNPDLSLSINGDRAGASMSFYYGADIVGKNPKCSESSCWNYENDNGWCEHSKGVTVLSNSATNKFNTVAQSYSVWFKPFDMLKVTAGQYSTNMNQETIDWSHTDTGVDTQGYALDLNIDAFFATVFFAPGWENAWFTKNENADATVGLLYAKAGYGADFGRIQGMFKLVDNDSMLLGLGYNNTFGSVNMFVNAMVGIDPAYDKVPLIRAEAFASTNIDAFGISVFVAGGYNLNDGLVTGWHVANSYGGNTDKASLGATMKLTYNLGVCTPYIYVKEANFLADSFSINVKPGVKGNLGSMEWEVAADMNFGSAFTINVPVSFTVAF